MMPYILLGKSMRYVVVQRSFGMVDSILGHKFGKFMTGITWSLIRYQFPLAFHVQKTLTLSDDRFRCSRGELCDH